MNTTPRLAPVLFISHGAPTFAIEPGLLGPQLHALGEQLTDIKAVLVVSPHWQTRGVQVMTTATPETVHDFGGFPAALYALQYPASGEPELALQVAQMLTAAGLSVSLEARRGLDHGAWVPLLHMLPAANLPVFQVSMPYDLDARSALQLGQALAAVRAQGVLVLASGSMTHNLQEFRGPAAQAQDYVVEFTHWVRQNVIARDLARMVDYRQQAPHARRAHPTDEHFLPLLVALGASHGDDTLALLDGGVNYGMLSMESYAWGMAS
jgi:4,5-DOPA dioxygenase extradiol